MKISRVVKKIRMCEHDVTAQVVLERYIEKQLRRERKRIWLALDEQIKVGHLSDDVAERVAMRYGLISAAQLVEKLGL